YVANTAATLADQIALARVQGSEIIVITMDLGVNAAPGDGTDGAAAGVTDSVYDEITTARNAGILVIVSAGNNFGRMASFTYAGGTVTITITGSAGDKVNLSWNDWDSAPNSGGTREDIETSGLFNKADRQPNAPPSFQHTLAANCAPCTLDIDGLTGSAIYLQVQVTGTATIDDVSGVAENTTNSIGRPADSPDALTVGAVCWDQAPPDPIPTHEIMSDSSRGPIFGNGGGAPPAGPFTARSQFKPDLVGPSHVSTSFDVNVGALDTGVNDACNSPEPTDGFNGTSAAAAHVAAMAALLRSHPTLGLDTPDELTDYMQSHSVDLYERPEAPGVVEPDGFDMAFGAGLAVLGSPTPGTLSVDHNTLANVACVSGPTVYVSPYSLSTDERALTTLGSRDNPYIHPAQALAAAATGACVVLVPGEYVSGIALNSAMLNNDLKLQAYQITSPAAAPSILWVNSGSNLGAGFTLINMTENFTIRGVQFIRANPLVQRVDNGTLPYPPRPFLAPK
ncbi:MAG: S8 family serine peptidase, partial [Anaerolineae bacterium]|nr:S8 family serine peptidase [Anaerolineae bacterium]